MTLQEYVNRYKCVSEDNELNSRCSSNHVVNQIFSKDLEDMLQDYLIVDYMMHYGLTCKSALDLEISL